MEGKNRMENMQNGRERITLESFQKPKDRKKQVLRVAAYARVSHETEMDSFDSQVQYYTAFIEEHPEWKLAGIYADPMTSGTSTQKRPGFLRMIQDCEAGKIDLILCKSISRFARNTMDTLAYVRRVRNAGTDILFESNHVDTRDACSEMMLTVWAAFAQEESRSISENTKWGIRKRFEEGTARWCRIYGYQKTEDGREYVVVPEEAETVRLIFRLCDQGKSMEQIRRDLGTKGIRSPKGNTNWTRSSIHKVLKNEKYAGDLRMQKFYTENHLNHRAVRNDGTAVKSYYIRNHHAPIVSREIFERVQVVLEMKSASRKERDDR